MNLRKIYPPSSWIARDSEPGVGDLWPRLLKNFQNNDIISRIIKKNGAIKNITKSNALARVESLSQKIFDALGVEEIEGQIKIFGAFNSCEESFFMMLTSAKLSVTAIANRLQIFKPHIILCKKKSLEKIQLSLKKNSKDTIPVLVLDSSENWDECEDKNSKNKNFNTNRSVYSSKDSLFTLFTSGSTGVPKGVTHNAMGYINYAEETTSNFFGVTPGKTIFTATDAGWINGHTYAFYGPLLCGGISVICEYLPGLLLPRILIKNLRDAKVDIFYTSVTTLRTIKSFVGAYQDVNTLSGGKINLERIGSCGEPLADSVGAWSIEFFKPKIKCIVNTYFQTETGGILIAPHVNNSVGNKFASIGARATNTSLRLAQEVMSEDELLSENVQADEILVVQPWEGIFKEIISDKDESYFTSNGFFRLKDIGFLDEEELWFVGGRSDDVINVSGHRISTAEIENVALEFPQIIEACAVPVEDNTSGSRPILYINLCQTVKVEEEEPLKENLKNRINEVLTSYHLPKEIYLFESLPKTKSGKIMRRIMRLYAEGDLDLNYIDITTLANKKDFEEAVARLSLKQES